MMMSIAFKASQALRPAARRFVATSQARCMATYYSRDHEWVSVSTAAPPAHNTACSPPPPCLELYTHRLMVTMLPLASQTLHRLPWVTLCTCSCQRLVTALSQGKPTFAALCCEPPPPCPLLSVNQQSTCFLHTPQRLVCSCRVCKGSQRCVQPRDLHCD